MVAVVSGCGGGWRGLNRPGDAGGGLFAEADVGAEAGQVLVAALGLKFGRAAPGLAQVL